MAVFGPLLFAFVLVLGSVMAKMQKVVGESIAVSFGALMIIALAVGFFLWFAANWGEGLLSE